ncbi:hypothetical protein LEMLEM_LOCUS14158 [Lemmus lemmus]
MGKQLVISTQEPGWAALGTSKLTRPGADCLNTALLGQAGHWRSSLERDKNLDRHSFDLFSFFCRLERRLALESRTKVARGRPESEVHSAAQLELAGMHSAPGVGRRGHALPVAGRQGCPRPL